MKTNEGKIYVVTYSDPNEEKEQTYQEKIYATCEQHAKQILDARIPDMKIEEVYYDDDCISQHYGSDGDVKIPEFELAKEMMYASLDVMMKDNTVEGIYGQNVIDLAHQMLTFAWNNALHCSEENHKDD